MKKHFREHYPYSELELGELWKNAVFVFDTNTLLNMYRYQRDTFREYVKVLKKLASDKKIFMPYHVGEEFFRNRHKVIRDYKESYDQLLSMHESFKSGIKSKYKYHPFIDLEQIGAAIEKSLEKTENELKEKKDAHPDWITKDDILEELTNIFEGAVGNAYDSKTLEATYEEGNERYENKIPPGYKDADKGGYRQFGDLIVWKQMIDFAKDTGKPIIFVTGDVKEDWWLIDEGKRLMPLPALKKEMRELAGVDFHAYTADRFLEIYNEHNQSEVDVKAIAEVKRVRQIQDLMNSDERSADEKEEERSSPGSRNELLSLVVVRALDLIDYFDAYDDPLPEYATEAIARSRARLGMLSRNIRALNRASRFMTRKVEHELSTLINSIESLCSDESTDEIVITRGKKFLKEIIKLRNTLLGTGI